MAFRQASFKPFITFNSAESAELLSAYLSEVDRKIKEEKEEVKHQVFAPSQIRCDRLSWFRLRGVEPDKVKNVDRSLSFRAMIGTACHRDIQDNLKSLLGENWISIADYLKDHALFECEVEDDPNSVESFVYVKDPPVRFACDGLIRWANEYALVEIKSVESGVWDELTEPRDEHIAQVTTYGALMNVRKVFMIYVNRVSGEIKCFQVDLKPDVMQARINQMRYVQDMAKKNLAPARLDRKDKWCNENYCPYYHKCKEYG